MRVQNYPVSQSETQGRTLCTSYDKPTMEYTHSNSDLSLTTPWVIPFMTPEGIQGITTPPSRGVSFQL